MIKIKVMTGQNDAPIIMSKITPVQEFLITHILSLNKLNPLPVSKIELIKNGEILYIDNFKDFIFSSEQELFHDTFKIYPTKHLIQKYPESFGRYGQNLPLYYTDKEVFDISKVYYPNIAYIRKFIKNYLNDLLVIKIKNSKVIYSENINDNYLKYISNMLINEKMDYTHFDLVFLENDTYTFYNLDMRFLLLDIAACLDKTPSTYTKTPYSDTHWNLLTNTKEMALYILLQNRDSDKKEFVSNVDSVMSSLKKLQDQEDHLIL